MTSRVSRVSARGAALGVGAVLLGGVAVGAAGAVQPSVAPVVAQVDEPTPDVPADEANADDATHEERVADLSARIRERLAELVSDDTITAQQADAVADHLAEQRVEERSDRPFDRSGEHRRGPDGPRHGGPLGRILGGDLLDEILGLEPRELLEQLRDGATLDEILEERGIDLDEVVDTVLSEARERFEQAVDEGRVDVERWDDVDVDEWLDRLEDRVREGLDRLTDGG